MNNAVRAAVGIFISVAALWIVLQSVDLARTADVLAGSQPAFILVMLATTTLDVAFRGLRWTRLLAPIAPVPYARVLGYTFIGYLANTVLPARLGELVRSHVLGQREGISRTTVLGTVVVERVIDTALVVAIAAGAILLLSVRGILANAVLLGLGFVTLLIVGLAVGLAAHRIPGAERITTILARWPRILELGRRLREGLHVAARPRTVAEATLLGIAAWSASIATFLLAGRAIGVELSIAQGALLSAGVALATIVPSGPGYVGTFELTAMSIASLFGVPNDAGFALALLVHAAIAATTIVGGLIGFATVGRRALVPVADEADPRQGTA